jgi:hypothetical protein
MQLRAVRQFNDMIRLKHPAQAMANAEHGVMLAVRCPNPKINVRSRHRNTLQHGRSHSGDQERDFFFAERMKEPMERREA